MAKVSKIGSLYKLQYLARCKYCPVEDSQERDWVGEFFGKAPVARFTVAWTGGTPGCAVVEGVNAKSVYGT